MAPETSPQSSPQASSQASQASSRASPAPAASPADSLQSSATTPAASQPSAQSGPDSASPSATRADRSKGQHPKAKRNRTSPADKAVLMQAYKQNPQPSQDEIAEITSRVSMSKQAVRIWFQNRRQNDRRKARPLSPQLIETITQGRISVSRFADPAGHNNNPFSPESFPADPRTASPPGLRAASSGLLDSPSCRSDVGPGAERPSWTPQGREPAANAHSAPPVPSWSTPGYLANRRNAAAAGAPSSASNPHQHDPLRYVAVPAPFDPYEVPLLTPCHRSRPLQSPSSHPSPSWTGADASAWKPSPQPSQIRLSMSITGQAEIVEAIDSPPRPIPPPTPVEPVPWPDLSRSSVARRSSLSAYSSRRVPRLLRGRSSDVHVWEDCASAASQEDPLIEQAKHESSGSATAEISLIRSLSSASSGSFDQGLGSRAKRRSHLLAHAAESRHAALKRPRLERSSSSQARVETGSVLSQRHNMRQRVPSYTTGKPKPLGGFDHLSLLASESDKENLSPDEDGNPRPFHRTLSSVSNPAGRRRLPSGPPSDKMDEKNPRRTLFDLQQHRPSATLARSATEPASASWAAYSKQFQTSGARQPRSPVKPDAPSICEDANDDGDEGRDADDVQRFMAVAAAADVSPSKKKEVDAAANLIALKFAR
ncbi:hypothetical protein VTH06DRAFT_825 [Thermothelomyces fergusii]